MPRRAVFTFVLDCSELPLRIEKFVASKNATAVKFPKLLRFKLLRSTNVQNTTNKTHLFVCCKLNVDKASRAAAKDWPHTDTDTDRHHWRYRATGAANNLYLLICIYNRWPWKHLDRFWHEWAILVKLWKDDWNHSDTNQMNHFAPLTVQYFWPWGLNLTDFGFLCVLYFY